VQRGCCARGCGYRCGSGDEGMGKQEVRVGKINKDHMNQMTFSAYNCKVTSIISVAR